MFGIELTEEECNKAAPTALYLLISYLINRAAVLMEEVKKLSPVIDSQVVLTKAIEGHICCDLLEKATEFMLEAAGKIQ